VEQSQAEHTPSKFGIGIEREVYSNPYFSYHYGYRSLSQIPERDPRSKLFEIENRVREKFKNINFHILFLNVSNRGTFVNFTLKDQSKYDELKTLGIVPVKNQNSFTFDLYQEGMDIPHREIFPMPNLDEFPIGTETLECAKKTIKDFGTMFECIGFNGCNGSLDYDDMHLELYPEKNGVGMEDYINTLEKYGVNTKPFAKYFLDYKKFSHIKVRIKKGEIKNIKYYRSLNVKIPQFYYE